MSPIQLMDWSQLMCDVTHILSQMESGDSHAAEELLPLVYAELRNLAAAKMAQENPGQTLQATALVHEAYLKLVNADARRHYRGREHFFRVAAEAMRRILVDRARRHRSLKRAGHIKRFDLETVDLTSSPRVEEVVAVSDALAKLEACEPDKAELVKLRYFGGLTVQEAAAVLGISRATADRHWKYARTWLYCALTGRHS